jgi:hypothetical protein
MILGERALTVRAVNAQGHTDAIAQEEEVVGCYMVVIVGRVRGESTLNFRAQARGHAG